MAVHTDIGAQRLLLELERQVDAAHAHEQFTASMLEEARLWPDERDREWAVAAAADAQNLRAIAEHRLEQGYAIHEELRP